MSVKLSIVIPAYNVEGYIESCLDSILRQTFQDYEVIVVDDGSTDRTPEILDQYAKENACIQVIHKKNEGVSVARNTGIDVATGEYFLFFDGDDFVEPYTCEELYQLAREKKVDTIIYGYHRFENGKVKETCYPKFKKDLYHGEELVRELLPKFIGLAGENINAWLKNEKDALFVENPALWRTMVSADVVRDHQIRFRRELKVGEDTLFIAEYLSYAKKCYVHKKCYYYLVTRETSTIFVYEQRPMAKLEGKIKLLEARLDLTEDIRKRRKLDIDQTWRGTVVMSAMELAFLFSAKNPSLSYRKRYQLFRQYIQIPEVRKSIKEFHLKPAASIKTIPFCFLKWNWNRILFFSTWCLHLIHYEFVRK